MINQIFANLHVKDLDKARDFYTKLGFTINEQFSDHTAACVVMSDHIFVMLLTHDKFKQFTPKEISDASKTTEVLNALSLQDKDQVNKMLEAAIGAGGSEARPAEDHGFMSSRAFNDLDGHIWEIFYMDMTAMPENE